MSMKSKKMFSGLFQQGILTSGTDLNWWASNPTDIAVNLTRQLAQNVACPTSPSQQLIDCLRNKTVEDIYTTNITAYVRHQ